jgi:hypothetical protein
MLDIQHLGIVIHALAEDKLNNDLNSQGYPARHENRKSQA